MKIILWFETVSYWVTLASLGGIHCVDQSRPEVTVLRPKACITLASCPHGVQCLLLTVGPTFLILVI